MKLGERQELFMRYVPRLIDKAHELGFEVRGGDLFRDPRLHGGYGKQTIIAFANFMFSMLVKAKLKEQGYRSYGKKNSEHKNKCAIDLNLTKDGAYCKNTEDHKELGEWWEAQHPYCRWGGRYNDGNHYEFLQWR